MHEHNEKNWWGMLEVQTLFMFLMLFFCFSPLTLHTYHLFFRISAVLFKFFSFFLYLMCIQEILCFSEG